MNKPEWNSGELLQTSGYYWQTCTLHAGVKLDIFSLIGKEQQSADDIAQALNADKRGVIMLLNALSAMGLLIKTEAGQYSNTRASAAWLSKDSPQYMGFMIMHHYHLVESWHHLDQSVITGQSPERSGPFLRMMSDGKVFSWVCLILPLAWHRESLKK